MAYGRLDVYWPDGKLESYLLEKETVSVGRAEGNDIALDTDTISRYHFSILHDDDDDIVRITDLDSANGTYVDGTLLNSNDPRELGDVEEIQAGALRLIFRSFDDAPTLPMRPADEDTQRLIREEAHFQVEFEQRRVEVWPAASSSVELAVTNTGDDERRFSVRVSGMPGEWLRVNRPEMLLEAGETGYVLLNIKPPRRHTTAPNDYQVTVEIEPHDTPQATLRALIEVSVRPYSGFGMAVIPPLDPGEPATVYLHNQGSGELSVSLQATDPRKALRFRLPQTALELQPGQRMRVELGLDAMNPPLVGRPVVYPFVVQAHAHNAAGFMAAAESKAAIAPRLPLWGLVSAAGIVLSVLAIGLVALLGLLSPSDPAITNVQLNESEIAAGDTLVISLEPQNLESIDVTVNGEIVSEGLPGDSETIAIDTAGYSGDLTINVLGRRGTQTVDVPLTAFVYQPMTVERFQVEPSTLVRNVVETLSVEWRVPGAEFVRLSGLNEFTNELFRASEQYEAVDRIEGIGGIPAEPLTITLYAEDNTGNALRESLTVPVVDPQCTAAGDVILREGPDPRYQQVATVAEGITVTVLAQSAEAGWLRVRLPGDVPGWGPRESFVCADNFAVSDLRTEANIPELPTTAPTLAPSPTALPTAQPTVTPEATAEPTVSG
jgi:hypothetical protein